MNTGMLTLDELKKEVKAGDPVYQPTLARVRALALAGNGRLDEGRALLAGGLASARDQGLAYEESLMLITSMQLDRIDGRPSPVEAIERLATILAGLQVEIATSLKRNPCASVCATFPSSVRPRACSPPLGAPRAQYPPPSYSTWVW